MLAAAPSTRTRELRLVEADAVERIFLVEYAFDGRETHDRVGGSQEYRLAELAVPRAERSVKALVELDRQSRIEQHLGERSVRRLAILHHGVDDGARRHPGCPVFIRHRPPAQLEEPPIELRRALALPVDMPGRGDQSFAADHRPR